ncbi:hypothetical protein [Halodesulfovibrio aestuarii]|uniref:hypothetical protein n=1 Tax=Halodesulfovibrio aestuarii TaxID=126333 RepID=UPI0004024BB2
MHTNTFFKWIWWLALTVILGSFLFNRYDQLLSGKPTYFDSIIFLVWIGVCLAPIFNEMKLFGLELKQEVQELKKDMLHQVALLKTELTSKIDVTSQNKNSIQVTTPSPPKDEEIPRILKQLEKTLGELNSNSTKPTERTVKGSPGIDTQDFFIGITAPEAIYLFSTRLAFEKLLKDFAWREGISMKRPVPLFRQLELAAKSLNLSKQLIAGIRDIIAVCNASIHGQKISSTQVYFVKEIAPKLYSTLKFALESDEPLIENVS